jgi:hypothetical protein
MFYSECGGVFAINAILVALMGLAGGMGLRHFAESAAKGASVMALLHDCQQLVIAGAYFAIRAAISP